MAGYFGTQSQQHLQAIAEANAAFIAATPGACQAGRTMGCDDPELFEWQRIAYILERDGVCGFRLLSTEKAENLKHRLEERNYRFDVWDVFLGDRETAASICSAVVGHGLPPDLRLLEGPSDPEEPLMHDIQSLMGSVGIVPFSGSFLAGKLGPVTTPILVDGSGRVVATAHGYMPHNTFSSRHGYAWGGLVSVDQKHRGKRLGSYINARMILSAFSRLGATHVYELVSRSNEISRRMVESCGLKFEPDLICGIATVSGERFTR